MKLKFHVSSGFYRYSVLSFAFNYFLFFIYMLTFFAWSLFWEKSICLHCAQCEWGKIFNFFQLKFFPLFLLQENFPQFFLFLVFSDNQLKCTTKENSLANLSHKSFLSFIASLMNQILSGEPVKKASQIFSFDFRIFIFIWRGKSEILSRHCCYHRLYLLWRLFQFRAIELHVRMNMY